MKPEDAKMLADSLQAYYHLMRVAKDLIAVNEVMPNTKYLAAIMFLVEQEFLLIERQHKEKRLINRYELGREAVMAHGTEGEKELEHGDVS